MSSRGQKGSKDVGREKMRAKNTKLGNKMAVVRKNGSKDDMEESDGVMDNGRKEVESGDMDR